MTNEEKIEVISRSICDFEHYESDSLFLLFVNFKEWDKLPQVIIDRLCILSILYRISNKEKDEELQLLNIEHPTYDEERLAAAFIRGANWKTQQIKKYLDKKLNKLYRDVMHIKRFDYNYRQTYKKEDLVYAKKTIVEEIINEFFKED